MNTITIDETSFVEAQEPNKTLIFPSETKQQARFELGVSMWVHKWEVLSTAVEHSWGGPESGDKRDWITKLVTDLFKENKIVDVLLIEETLLYAMLDEFDVDIQDDSALPIAMNILKCWEYVNNGGVEDIQNMYLEWKHKKDSGIKEHSHEVLVQKDPLNPNSSSDESEEESDEEMEIEEEHVHNEPIVDDDGFEMVQPKGRNRH
ncbi:hypothetical protein FOG51_03931 [Hanseniaspora uvarum]|mgnify:CR=1 FL=1|uniref:Pre-rRNA-processing protein TSR2 n=1 Tax=Hanseniaspora uvarum TaxID=29833 RepID=A0A1E5S2A9_HANUV|nr:hypothetical protein FOG48_02005 [Hanseniaspora uvarum]KAF0271053.1 hypothetical protein FOG51_03931 [Hanseniaspora uvarum]KAF0275058.1 hypothetical protein FOG50_04103 [Hanseniaspora uvarum]OEJ93093.1 Pre-rRNA-processing protein TSR2 [Hanseniaspora uvarum]GMM39899.1 Tsr2 protein [Hanseniaspora uvarum]